MPAPLTRSISHQWLNRIWWLWLVILLAVGIRLYATGYLCLYSATDFRGYYASAQIAWEHGFAWVYNQPLQDEYQARLTLHCLDGALSQPRMFVSMPYLPAFTVLLLPLVAVDFSLGYLLWTTTSTVILVLYSAYFCYRLAGRVNWIKLMQWVICLPLFSTLALGQMNVFLVVCLGEFTLGLMRGKELRSGLWLAGMLLKPHTLILLLPGLLLARRWKVLGGFFVGWSLALGLSFLLAGKEGMQGMLSMVGQFASPQFPSITGMMNWRALAINLQTFSPGWLAWGVAVTGMVVIVIYCLGLWWSQAASIFGKGDRPSSEGDCASNDEDRPSNEGDYSSIAGEPSLLGNATRNRPSALVWLVVSTYAATLVIAWHSHFYMLLPLVPLLIYLDGEEKMPVAFLAAWIWGPLILYFILEWLNPDWARQGLGFGMMVLGMVLAWGGKLFIRQFSG